MRIKLIILFCFTLFTGFSQRDTLALTIGQADKMFLAANFQLMASSMNIEAQKAQEIQAKLYPNPVLTADFNAIDPENNQAFHVGSGGQQSVQLEQLIILGGKRKTQIDLAKTSTQMAEFALQDLLRQLKFQLHTGLFLLSQKQLLISKYDKQLGLLDEIVSAYETQVPKGNIPLKDLVRLKGVYLNLSNERAAIYGDYFDQMTKVQTLLQTKKIVSPIVSDAEIRAFVVPINVELLYQEAVANRPDLLMSQKDLIFAQQYFSLQQKLAKPDITLFASYDQRGGAFQRQVNLGFAVPLMFWNKNQGNIKTAQAQIQAKNFEYEGLKSQVLAEVNGTYLQYQQTVKEYMKNSHLYNDDFEITLKGMSENFQKGNVSVLEFVDFFESYNNALSEMARTKIQLATSIEQIKLSTGKEQF
jgi:cobalt-zinc-cadmium efflux system outer membrane protein